jgi:hypothetical protein
VTPAELEAVQQACSVCLLLAGGEGGAVPWGGGLSPARGGGVLKYLCGHRQSV